MIMGPAVGAFVSRIVIEEVVVAEFKFHSHKYNRTSIGSLGYP